MISWTKFRLKCGKSRQSSKKAPKSTETSTSLWNGGFLVDRYRSLQMYDDGRNDNHLVSGSRAVDFWSRCLRKYFFLSWIWEGMLANTSHAVISALIMEKRRSKDGQSIKSSKNVAISSLENLICWKSWKLLGKCFAVSSGANTGWVVLENCFIWETSVRGGLYFPFPNLGFDLGGVKEVPKVGLVDLYNPFPNRGFFDGIVKGVVYWTQVSDWTQKGKKDFTVGWSGCKMLFLCCQKGPFSFAKSWIKIATCDPGSPLFLIAKVRYTCGRDNFSIL